MSSMVLSGDTSGTVTVTVPAVAGTNTATLPAATGTVMVSGNMPAFSAYQSSAQTSSSSTNLKILFQTKEFDTATCFDTSLSRFTPTVAGYYQISASINMVTSVATWQQCKLYKNGSFFKQSFAPSSSSNIDIAGFSGLVYANGTTDYFEIYGIVGSGQNTGASQSVTWFAASMVRAA